MSYVFVLEIRKIGRVKNLLDYFLPPVLLGRFPILETKQEVEDYTLTASAPAHFTPFLTRALLTIWHCVALTDNCAVVHRCAQTKFASPKVFVFKTNFFISLGQYIFYVILLKKNRNKRILVCSKVIASANYGKDLWHFIIIIFFFFTSNPTHVGGAKTRLLHRKLCIQTGLKMQCSSADSLVFFILPPDFTLEVVILKKKKSKKSSLIFVYLYKAKAKTYKNYNNGANYIQKELVHLIINDGVYVIKKKKKP
ncbi:hypothetical protein AB205_0064480 [Aquarana catesbeiana]|uniref:Uncharacterized protein n=1 Tax=Aquarana catesbeiana TaxID=8400 RepID=A0A2G9RRT7_AQUCT|nr:hypothetical protein AB205_0064480 [Aquarana catesbeiana]